jgi:protein-tyrosine phosphatase
MAVREYAGLSYARPMPSVCFVCLGNICRSPTAEGVMRSLVEQAGLADQFELDSAGTGGYHVGA